jgi:hypothetical protein
MTKLALGFLFSVSLAVPAASSAPVDSFALWQRGALRGANVMLAQCAVDDLRVLRSWGANLAEIPVLNVYAPTPPYAFQPESLAKLDRAVEAAEQAGLYVVLTCREGPGRPDFNRSHEIWREASAQDAYEQHGWSWAYWAFREWDVMNIERTADPPDKTNHSDTPLLRLFKTYFAKDEQFFKGTEH